MARSTVAVKFVGDVKSLLGATNKADGALGKLGGTAAKMGKVAALGVTAVAGAVTAVALKSANTLKRVGGEVLKLQRYTGATAEEASRLRFAAKQSGIDVEVLTKSLGLLSKNLAGTKLDKLGLGLKDASGKALPLNDSLLKIAQRFEKMPNGAEKTALAMQIFGKSGAQLIPFLNKGADGLRELEAMSDKYGSTLSGKDLDAVKESTKNQRLFSSAMEGLQIQIGRYVLPILTKFTGFLARNMPAAIAAVRAGMQRLAPLFDAVGSFIDDAAAAVGAFVYAFRTGFTQDEGTPVERLALMFRDVLWPALQKVGQFITANLKPILIALGVAFIALTAPVTSVVAALLFAYARFELVRNVVAAVVSFFSTVVIPAVSAFAKAIADQFAALQQWTAKHWAAISEAIGHVVAVVTVVIKTFVAVISAVWRMWGDNIMSVVGSVFGAVRTIIATAIKIVTGVIEVALALINGDWGRAWSAFKGILSAAWNGIVSLIRGQIRVVVSIVSGLGEAIGRAASGMFNGIKSAFRSAINWIIRAWNRLEFKIPGFDPPGPGPSFGGFTLGVPNIPQLAAGAIVRARRGGTLVNVGEGGSDEAVVPLGRGGFAGVTHVHHWHIAGSILAERDVMALINRAERKGIA